MARPGPPSTPLRAAVVGSVNVDLFLTVDELPARGETVLARGMTRAIGGKGANQAVALARLGAAVTLIGAIGDDDDGRAAAAAIDAAGVDLAGVHLESSLPTGTAAITLDARGENTIVVTAGANVACTADTVRRQARQIATADLLLAQLELPLAAVLEAFRVGATGSPLCVLNAAPAQDVPGELLSLADVLVVNEVEAGMLAATGRRTGPEDVATALVERGPKVVAVTLGSRGALAVDASGTVWRVAALPVTPLDTVGAGDAFVACFALLHATGRSIEESLRAANAAAALSTLVPGAQAGLPTWAQVEAALDASGT